MDKVCKIKSNLESKMVNISEKNKSGRLFIVVVKLLKEWFLMDLKNQYFRLLQFLLHKTVK